jgi:simple sugar transport system permease protein
MRVLTGLINGMISGATPILLAALGGSYTFYAGVFNIAMEGMMLVGAFFAVWGSYTFHSWLVGLLLAVLGSVGLGLIFILFAVVLKTDEFVTGIALNLFALGATTYLLRRIFEVKGVFTSSEIQPIPSLTIPILDRIPFLGDILSGQNLVVYLAVAFTFASAYLVFRTRWARSASGGLQPGQPGDQRGLPGPCASGFPAAVRHSVRGGRGFPLPGVRGAVRREHVGRTRLDLIGGDHPGQRQPLGCSVDLATVWLF